MRRFLRGLSRKVRGQVRARDSAGRSKCTAASTQSLRRCHRPSRWFLIGCSPLVPCG